MDAHERSGLARLNSFQIAGLALLTSTFAALAVLFGVRLAFGGGRKPAADEAGVPRVTAPGAIQPAVDGEMSSTLPEHFTEDLIVPGFTETGEDVLRDDEEFGRSPEGV